MKEATKYTNEELLMALKAHRNALNYYRSVVNKAHSELADLSLGCAWDYIDTTDVVITQQDYK